MHVFSIRSIRPRAGFAAAAMTLTLAAGMLAPAAALAAAPRTDVWKSVGVSLTDLGPGKQPTYVVSAELKDNIKLPTSFYVALPLPTGSEISWAGEIIPGAKNDIMLKLSGKTGKPNDLVIFRVTKSRIVQIEALPALGILKQVSSKRVDVNMFWVADSAVPAVRMAVQVPAGFKAYLASKITTDVAGTAGSRLYFLEKRNVKAKQEMKIGMAILAPVATSTADVAAPGSPAPAGGATGSTGTRPLLLILAGLLVVAVGFLGYALFAGSKQSTREAARTARPTSQPRRKPAKDTNADPFDTFDEGDKPAKK
jgi:hypothetical protein